MADGVARVLVDSAGNLVKVTQDGSDYKIEVIGKLRDAGGTIVNPAKEDGNLATLAGKDFATQTTLAALLSAFNAEDFATQTTLAALLSAFNAEDFATQTTLASVLSKLTEIDNILDSIKDTDGIKKITDPLPAGTNNIGKLVITDGTHDAEVSASGKLEVSVGVDAKNVVLAYLLNGTSEEMAVDGDPTPQEFVWTPGSAAVEGSALAFIIEDATLYFGDKFGGIAALSNGVLITVKAQDVVHTIATIYRTRELLQLASPGGFDLYSATPDSLKAELSLEGFQFMPSGTYATDDYVKVTIRDDIDALSHMSALFKGREVGS